MTNQRKSLDKEAIRAEYIAGDSYATVAERHGTTRHAIMEVMKERQPRKQDWALGHCPYCRELVAATMDGPDDFHHAATGRIKCAVRPTATIDDTRPRMYYVQLTKEELRRVVGFNNQARTVQFKEEE